MSWEILTGEVLTWIIETWSNVGGFVNNISITPSAFWSWIWSVIKSILLWFVSHRYWFVWFVLCYALIIILYNVLWWKVVVYFQKKWYEEYKKNI